MNEHQSPGIGELVGRTLRPPQEVALFIVDDARLMLEADVPKAMGCQRCPTCSGTGRSFSLFDALYLERDIDFKLSVTM